MGEILFIFIWIQRISVYPFLFVLNPVNISRCIFIFISFIYDALGRTGACAHTWRVDKAAARQWEAGRRPGCHGQEDRTSSSKQNISPGNLLPSILVSLRLSCTCVSDCIQEESYYLQKEITSKKNITWAELQIFLRVAVYASPGEESLF